MQLIILTPGFPADETDTSCIPMIQDFVLGWKENFPEVKLKVISFQYPERKKYEWNGINCYSVGGKNRKGFFRFITWWRVMLQLFRLKRKKEMVLITFFFTEATFVGQLFARIFGVKQIAVAIGQDVKKTNRYLKRINFKKLTPVVLNKKMDNYFLKVTRRKANHVVPMGMREVGSRQYAVCSRRIDVLVACSLIRLKQVDVAIRIISEVKKDFQGLKTEIIGDGEERNRLEKLVSDLDLKKNILFCGSLKREEVFQKMNQSKILLHTSEYEGQATVITEALACGTTVVCFDVGRIADHEKIHVCADEKEMILVLKKLLRENHFDFSPVVPFTIKETIERFQSIIESNG